MKSIVCVILIFTVCYQMNVVSNVPIDRIRLCIMNCGQCKSMYGQYFLGQQCAQHCIDHKELLMSGELQVPDCNAPHSILPYIRKLMDDTDAKNDII
ncbi:unnamed protein product [Oppiella nova]|uniref:Eclosion hormone n=1 Tax=Oppiella nova TaxID=334625 RepID=A0A7R9MAB4_9ACAR|nr:unnamed protein product [Oppiella nova]CAG2173690.1 unnamed protein product [Oppiella nova]